MKLLEYSLYAFVVVFFTLLFAVLLSFNSKAEEACKQKNGIMVRTSQGYTCIKAESVKETK